MKITLSANVKAESFRANMIVSRKSDRDDLLPIVRAAMECPDRTDLVDYLHEKIYSNLPKSFSHNVLFELQLMGIIDESYSLTDLGRYSIMQGEIMIPEDGTFSVVVADLRPVCDQTVFKLSPFNRKEEKEVESVTVPVDRIQYNKVLKMFGTDYSINRCDQRGHKGNASPSFEVILKFDSQSAQWSLSVGNNREIIPLEVSNSFQHNVWENVLDMNPYGMRRAGTKWEASFDSLNDNERQSFKSSREYRLRGGIPDILPMDLNVSVENIDLVPKTLNDAQKWLDWLVMEEVNTYITDSEIAYLYGEKMEEKIFQNYILTSRSPISLIEKFNVRDRKYWYLIAPVDFRMEEGA